MKQVFTLNFILVFSIYAVASSVGSHADSVKKEKSWKIFGAIYGGFYYNVLKKYDPPKTAFEVQTGILGYKNQFSENVDAVIMLDVSKTTRDIKNRFDTTVITYVEGNNYTFYLKQAEIHWKINSVAELSLGQLLSSQYLVSQDKWWDHRYIYYTVQEVNKYGAPADFGARLKLNLNKTIVVNLCMVNGEGPARWQDNNSNFLYSADIEYRNHDSLVFRLYGDYREPTFNLSGKKTQSVFNFFSGYSIKLFKFGAEFSYIYHANYSTKDVMGLSGYVIYKFLKKFEAIGRYDYFQDISSFEDNHYMIAGIQYEPAKNFYLSANYRQLWPAYKAQVYLNFGAKF